MTTLNTNTETVEATTYDVVELTFRIDADGEQTEVDSDFWATTNEEHFSYLPHTSEVMSADTDCYDSEGTNVTIYRYVV